MVSPQHWGKHAWKFLHIVTVDYPDRPSKADKKHYLTLFKTLAHTLPCRKCRESYSALVREYPPELESRESLIKWLYNIHHMVNVRRISEGKKVGREPSFERFRRKLLMLRVDAPQKKE